MRPYFEQLVVRFNWLSRLISVEEKRSIDCAGSSSLLVFIFYTLKPTISNNGHAIVLHATGDLSDISLFFVYRCAV